MWIDTRPIDRGPTRPADPGPYRELDRLVATLEVLAGFAQRTPVIFFTHHRHMLDLARRTVPDAVLQVHRL